VQHPDFPAIMTALLTTNYMTLCQETVWLFANILNNENVTVQEEFVDLDLMDRKGATFCNIFSPMFFVVFLNFWFPDAVAKINVILPGLAFYPDRQDLIYQYMSTTAQSIWRPSPFKVFSEADH
jgi:hypothetical protein